jgi:Domain of unknown function (DUF1338)
MPVRPACDRCFESNGINRNFRRFAGGLNARNALAVPLMCDRTGARTARRGTVYHEPSQGLLAPHGLANGIRRAEENRSRDFPGFGGFLEFIQRTARPSLCPQPRAKPPVRVPPCAPLSAAAVPVHSTAFRPIKDEALRRNSFRVFTWLLRLDLIEDIELRREAAALAAPDVLWRRISRH